MPTVAHDAISPSLNIPNGAVSELQERLCSIGERRGGTSHLEGVVLEQVGDAGHRLVVTSGFDDDGDGRDGCLWSTAATRIPLASTTVAKQRRKTALYT